MRKAASESLPTERCRLPQSSMAENLNLCHIPSPERFPFWQEMVARASIPVHMRTPYEENFAGAMTGLNLDDVKVIEYHYPSLDAWRTPRLIRQSDPELCQLAFSMTGEASLTQDRATSFLRANEFTFYSSSRPYSLSHRTSDGPIGAIVVQIPHRKLSAPGGRLSRFNACRISGASGLGGVVAGYLRQLVNGADQYRETDIGRLRDVTVDLVTALLAHHLDADDTATRHAQRRVLITRIEAFIGRHLGDPALTPQAIAAAHHISVRTLHRLFHDREVSVAESIRARRLDRCRRDLADPLRQQRPIHAVAARWGFVDQAHFSRVFRAAYGLAPQEYRRQRLPMDRLAAGLPGESEADCAHGAA